MQSERNRSGTEEREERERRDMDPLNFILGNLLVMLILDTVEHSYPTCNALAIIIKIVLPPRSC